MTLEPLSEEATLRVQEALDTLQDYQSNLTTPEELHYFAAKFNWDNGSLEPLRWVIRNSLCDKGTAFLIYWSAQPKYLYGKYVDQSQVVRNDLEKYELVKEIEEKVLANFYTHQHLGQITPPNQKKIRLEIYAQDYKKQRIPEEMFDFIEANIA